MKSWLIFLITMTLSVLATADERLTYAATVGGISAMFNAVPRVQQGQNEAGTFTEGKVSGFKSGADYVFHGLLEARRTDGLIVEGLGKDYPNKVASGITSNGTVVATVHTASSEYDLDTYPSMDFTLNLRNQDVDGMAHYWAFVKDGKAYQAFTWCFGNIIKSCESFHSEFRKTVSY